MLSSQCVAQPLPNHHEKVLPVQSGCDALVHYARRGHVFLCCSSSNETSRSCVSRAAVAKRRNAYLKRGCVLACHSFVAQHCEIGLQMGAALGKNVVCGILILTSIKNVDIFCHAVVTGQCVTKISTIFNAWPNQGLYKTRCTEQGEWAPQGMKLAHDMQQCTSKA